MHTGGQQAYDRGSTIFSPDGRLYQVEYAREAVARGGPIVGVTTDDGVVLASCGSPRSPLVVPESIEKLHDVDGRLAVATAGHVADGRRLVEQARVHAQRERLRYGERPDVETLARALADRVQQSTQAAGTRPFGAAVLVGGVSDVPRLYELDPSGASTEWQAAAIGGDREAIQAVLVDEYERTLDERAGLALAVRALAAGDRELSRSAVDVGVAREDGFDLLEPAQREVLVDETERAS